MDAFTLIRVDWHPLSKFCDAHEKIMRRNLSTSPALAIQQAKNELTLLSLRESSGTQIRLHLHQFMCWQSCRPAKEHIQNPHNDAAAHTPQTCARDLKIRMQPLRTGSRRSCDGRHQLLQLIFAKTVEKTAASLN